MNKSIDKAFRILDLFDRETARMNATEIATALSTRSSIIFPIMRTLEAHGYLIRDETKRYRLGYKFLERANLVLQHTDLHTRARLHLRKLATSYSVNAHIGIFYSSSVLYLHRELGRESVAIGEMTGLREPAYCTALGKTLLAFLPEADLESYLAREKLTRFTPSTIMDPAELREACRQIREKGYAVSQEEAHEGVVGVGAPVTDFKGEVRAAISISIPKSRWQDEMDRLITAVMATAMHLSNELGDAGRAAEVRG